MTSTPPGHSPAMIKWAMSASAEPLLASTVRQLTHAAAIAQATGRTPSLAASVARDGESVWFGARGSVQGAAPTVDTQYRIGSITKTFVAVLLMRLRDEGRLDLGEPFDRHLPNLLPPEITVGQLLAHTGGLATETPPPWWERVTGAVRPRLDGLLWPDPLRHPPGRRWHYSNTGFALAGALVERLHGAPWAEVLHAELLGPLGMTRTSAMPQPPHALGWAVHPWADVALPEPSPDMELMAPAGQLWSTTTDLTRWAALLAGRRPDVLAASTAAEMREPASGSPDGVSSYGLGLMLHRTPTAELYGHVGSMPGFLATLWIDQAQSLSAVVFANVTHGPDIPGLAAELLRIVAAAEPAIPEPWIPRAVGGAGGDDLLALTGLWYRGAQPIIAHARPAGGLRLTAAQGDQVIAELRRAGDGWVVTTPGYYHGELLAVAKEGDGTSTHLSLGSVVLTREPYEPGHVVPGGRDDDGWQLPT